MFADLASLGTELTIEGDICIIGGGAAGISIASEFIGQAAKVCLIESGGFDLEPETQELYSGSSVGQPVALDTGRLRMFGGTTNHWGGRCAEFSPAEWDQRSWIARSGWPIPRGALSPYYERAQRACGFLKPWASRDETFKSLGLDSGPQETEDIQTQLWRFASPNESVPYNFGKIYREALGHAENIRVLLHANLVGFVTDPMARNVERISVRSLSGNTASVSARYFVLCTGGIENARLLLLPSEHAPSGLGNTHDLVGRFLMQHVRLKAATIAAAQRLSPLEDLYSEFRGLDGIKYEVGVKLSEGAQRKARVLNCGGDLEYDGDPDSGSTAAQDVWRGLRNGRWTDDLGTKMWRLVRDLPAFEANAERWLWAGRHPLLPLLSVSVTVDVEQLPNPDSRVTLGVERDKLGLPRSVADWRVSDMERETARQFMLALGKAVGAWGLGRLRVDPALDQPGSAWTSIIKETYHYLGTTRMAADASDGVVDTNCRVFAMDNLFLAGSSVFPVGGHVNPTLTIVALALRLADYLRESQVRGG